MKVLALAINFEGFTVATLFHEQCALKQKVESLGGKFFLYGPGYDYPTGDVSAYVDRLTAAGDRPDVILCYLSERRFFEPLPEEFCSRFSLSGAKREFPRGLEKVSGIPKVIWINDFWHMSPPEWEWTLLRHGFTHALATYAPPFLRESDFRATFPESVREKVSFHPVSRGISPEIFTDYGEDRDLDVTLLGARNEFYPLREYFHQSLAHQSWFRYFNADHPGYGYDQQATLCGQAYARVLSRSRIFVSCTGRYLLPFIKIYEVLACGALLMCDRPCGADAIGLVDGETYVQVDQANFMERLHHYLNHEQQRARIAAAGRELFLDRHTTERNAQRIHAILAHVVQEHHRAPVACVAPEPRPDAPAPPKERTGPLPGSGISKLISRGLGRMLQKPAEIERAPVQAHSPWEETKGGTFLDWGRVVEVRHALEICQLQTLREVSLVQRFGLNAHWGETAVITEHPEIISVRAKILKLLAGALGATVLCEVGTARGLQSIFWSDYLKTQGVVDSIVATCDITGHDDPVYRTPLTASALWTRRELWRQEPVASAIQFVPGDSSALDFALQARLAAGRKIDLLYVDGRHDEEGAYRDYLNLKRHTSEDSVLVFDDCDPRFPGVEQAVNRVAAEMDAQLRVVSFWPSAYKVVVLNSKVPLSRLADQLLETTV